MLHGARRGWVSHLVLATILFTSTGVGEAANPFDWLNRKRQQPVGAPEPPPKKPLDPVEHLSWQIDWLERNIDEFGTVVAKVPDVWGERRMMKHRQEYEELLARELGKFEKGRIAGAKFIQDQAFLAAALAVQAAATDATGTPSSSTNLQLGVTAGNPSTTQAGSGQDTITITGITDSTVPSPATGFGFDAAELAFSKEAGGLDLEQTVDLDQLSRYLNHLHELRRINEGDDTADAPGYALHLVRIPISVLPGHQTRKGHGAEITITAEPHLGPELLPMAFRDLVINDLVDQLAIPITRFLNGNRQEVCQLMEVGVGKYEEVAREINEKHRELQIEHCLLSNPDNQGIVDALADLDLTFFSHNVCYLGDPPLSAYTLYDFQCELQEIIQVLEARSEEEGAKLEPAIPFGGRVNQNVYEQAIQDLSRQFEMDRSTGEPDIEEARAQEKPLTELSTRLSEIGKRLREIGQSVSLTQIQLPSATRKATLPFPATQLLENYGMTNLGLVTKRAYDAFRVDLLNSHVVHVTDVQAFLREELHAAYELMSTDAMRATWETEATNPRQLYNLVRQRHVDQLRAYRSSFAGHLGPETQNAATGALAWCVLVESVLLNERLIRDMRETGGNRDCACVVTGWLPFFGPDPPQEARALFAEYVKCRWPVHVFALDPVTSEQNIAEVSSIYREMQIAVALSFAAGNTGVQTAMQTMRRLQRDTATIALNRTIVSFGHGDDTFGWRFYPRFQTPPVEGNMTVFFRDLIGGGPTDEQLRRKQLIEPGMRECVALIVMPSFIPYVTFDARGNWFKLANPGHTAVNMINTVRYSRAIQTMHAAAEYCAQVEHLYRDGEVRRLLRRVHQLDRELPMQTMSAQVPHENTLGGFEMFSSGTSELAPELLGWYGAPGVNRSQPTRLFLSGDNFSVHQTRLIVGNTQIPARLLSRQIMEVTLPPGLPVVQDDFLCNDEQYEGYVDAHLATPYGVSGHLLIPVVRDRAALFGSAIVRMQPAIISLRFTYEDKDDKLDVVRLESDFVPDGASVSSLRIDVPPNLGFPEKIDAHFYPRYGRDQLEPKTLSDIRLAADGRGYSINGTKSGELITDLAGSVKNYIDYLLKFNLLRGRSLELTMSAYVGPAANPIPVKGDVIINVTVEPAND